MLSRRRLKTAIPFSDKAEVKTNLQGIETNKNNKKCISALRMSVLILERQTKHIPRLRAADNTDKTLTFKLINSLPYHSLKKQVNMSLI